MAGNKKNIKITKYRRYSLINIGTLLFGSIFIYMIICIFLYITADHVTSYEVTAGSISGNYRYRALALKTEQVVTSDTTGKITYYAREGGRASTEMTVCSVGEYADVTTVSSEELTSDDLEDLKDQMKAFSLSFRSSSFQNVYDFKMDLESYLMQQKQGDISTMGLRSQCNAPVSGFVVYSMDGMEDLTEEQITEDLFYENAYQKTNLRFQDSVKAGAPIYKLVTSENWALYFPLDAALATELQDRRTIRFRFLKDNCTFTANFSVIQNEGEYFGKISLNNSLVRYVSDRYLEIELLMDRKKGLKIPTSAIAEKTFYKIPEEYAIENKDTEKEITLLKESFLKDGSSNVRYVTATVYAKEDNCYLVSTDLFREGDCIQMLDTSKKYQIQANNARSIQGVYNINKGYAVFREVTIIDENEEFCIVESNNMYGLNAHDHIVLDAADVEADDIVY